jgi:hypothetical protein
MQGNVPTKQVQMHPVAARVSLQLMTRVRLQLMIRVRLQLMTRVRLQLTIRVSLQLMMAQALLLPLSGLLSLAMSLPSRLAPLRRGSGTTCFEGPDEHPEPLASE